MANEGLIAHSTMLVLTRESRGLRQAELAQAMSSLAGEPVSQGYVSRAEAGRLAVTDQRLDLYAQALDYPPRLLCVEADVDGVGIGLVHHRKRASLGAPALRRIHAELTLARYQVQALLRAAGDVKELYHEIARVIDSVSANKKTKVPVS